MDFDHVPNQGIMSPQFLWCLKNRLKKEKKNGVKKKFGGGNGSLKLWWNDHKNWWNYAWKLWPLTIKYFSIFLLFFFYLKKMMLHLLNHPSPISNSPQTHISTNKQLCPQLNSNHLPLGCQPCLLPLSHCTAFWGSINYNMILSSKLLLALES